MLEKEKIKLQMVMLGVHQELKIESEFIITNLCTNYMSKAEKTEFHGLESIEQIRMGE